MNDDLNVLKITAEEIERLIGIDVNENFIGGTIGGVYRAGTLKNPKRLLSLIVTEILVAALIFVFSIPIGLFFTQSAQGIADAGSMLRFLQITGGTTVAIVLAWNVYMQCSIPRFKSLMHLLDEVDRFNDVLHAVSTLDSLEELSRDDRETVQNANQRASVLEALRMTRDSLVSGLLTEKILRENRGLLARRQDLLTNIETNLSALKTLEVNQQATEYATLLSEALQIGVSVHQEVQRLSNSK